MSKFLVLEFGSKSLKIHRRSRSGAFQKANVPWTLGHEVYRDGRISAECRRRVAQVIRRLSAKGFRREGMLAIATGAVRDAPDREEFLRFMREEAKVALRLLSGREEASLLAQGFLTACGDRPALVIDIGGGSLEMAYLGPERTVLRDSLPLGAIRAHYLGAEPSGGWNAGLVAELIDGVLREAAMVHVPVVHGTGGPLKAIAKLLGRPRVDLAAIAALEEQVLRDGPPPGLSAERSMIFLPGVMVLRRMLLHCRAEALNYISIPIGRIFLERFLGQTHEGLTDTMNARLLQNIRLTRLHHETRDKD